MPARDIPRATIARMAPLVAAVVVMLVLLPPTCFGQVTVETDRPDVANSTKTVPPGYLQLENGYRYTLARVGGEHAVRRSSAETTIRVGATPSLELRMDAEPYVDLRNGEGAHGLGDVVFGAKWRLLDAPDRGHAPAVGISPFVKLPSADAPIGTERLDFGLLGLLSFELPGSVSLDVNLGIAALGQPDRGGFLMQGLSAVSLGWKLHEAVTAFGELFFASRAERDGGETLGADAGLICVVHRRVALDVAVETTLRGRGPTFGLRIGATVLFGR